VLGGAPDLSAGASTGEFGQLTVDNRADETRPLRTGLDPGRRPIRTANRERSTWLRDVAGAARGTSGRSPRRSSQ